MRKSPEKPGGRCSDRAWRVFRPGRSLVVPTNRSPPTGRQSGGEFGGRSSRLDPGTMGAVPAQPAQPAGKVT